MEEYATYRKLPTSLRQRICAYYEHRFRGKMFGETTILAELNDCLREVRVAAHHSPIRPPPPPDRKAEYCDERVCVSVCVCLSAIISSELHVRSLSIFVHVTNGRGSVLVWRRSDMLCTSGFTDDVIFAHKPRLLDVAAQLKRSTHAVLGLAINCAQ